MSEPKKVSRRRHPGRGKGRTRNTPRGRQVDAESLAEVRALLADRTPDRAQLIENLHLIQDHYGQIAQRHLAALAELMRLSMAEVYEVATFYAHFDVVSDDTERPDVTVRVCESLSCAMNGAADLQSSLEGVGGERRLSRGLR